MIRTETIQTAMNAFAKATTFISYDIEEYLKSALSEQTDYLSHEHIEITLENARLAAGKCFHCKVII